MPLHPPLLLFANALPLTLLTYVCGLPPLPTLQLKTLLLPLFFPGKWTLERGGVGDVTFEKAPGIGHPPSFSGGVRSEGEKERVGLEEWGFILLHLEFHHSLQSPFTLLFLLNLTSISLCFDLVHNCKLLRFSPRNSSCLPQSR